MQRLLKRKNFYPNAIGRLHNGVCTSHAPRGSASLIVTNAAVVL